MPAFILFIGTAVKELFEFLIKNYTKRIAYGTIFIALFVATVVTFASTVNAQYSELLASLPNNTYTLAGLSLVPTNFLTCVILIAGTKAASIVAIWSMSILRIKMKVR